MTRAQPPQQPPPQQRLRVRYAKRGRARFASHRDIGRAIERALRRAEIPMAYSSGFSPHPRISYANASPTGAASESEYLELGFATRLDPEWVVVQLNLALPTGLVVLAAAEASSGSLSDQLTASRWRIEVPGVRREDAERAVAELLAQAEYGVQRMTKTGMRAFDVRSAILSLQVLADAGLDLISAIDSPLVRPDDVVQALGAVHEGFRPGDPPVYTRLAHGTYDGVSVVDPIPIG
ncbi:MAG: TIGR03936 family radical SAM-associated protein [Propionicimonas sp.]